MDAPRPANPVFDPTDPMGDLASPALALCALRDDPALRNAGPRAALDEAARLGYRAVVLDASTPGLRARDLDRSARRDLASVLRRSELAFCGLDVWIPPEHFASTEHADRASVACAQAIDLAADLSRDARGEAVVSLTLPRSLEGERLTLFGGVLRAMLDHADRAGVALADHSLPLGEASADASSPLMLGVDPAAMLLRGLDPVVETARWGSRVRVARWTDADALSRVAPATPSRGRLDLRSYAAIVASTTGATRLTLDLRGVPDPLSHSRTLARTLP
jgi:hypothetical protein